MYWIADNWLNIIGIIGLSSLFFPVKFIFKLHSRLKHIENMHQNKQHVGEICPKCGRMSLRKDVQCHFVSKWDDESNIYTQIATEFCSTSDCNYSKIEKPETIYIHPKYSPLK